MAGAPTTTPSKVNKNETIDQQPEWFLLAKSSYKMKKYGECLFAVSKAAGAIAKRENLNKKLDKIDKQQWGINSNLSG